MQRRGGETEWQGLMPVQGGEAALGEGHGRHGACPVCCRGKGPSDSCGCGRGLGQACS